MNLSYAEPDVLVEMGQYKIATSAQSIGTVGLGPCVGLAIYSPEYPVMGLLAHTLGSELETIKEMLDSEEFAKLDATKLRAWLSGGEIVEFEGEVAYEHIREDSMSLLELAGISTVNVKEFWVNHDGYANMLLNCGSGVCNISRVDLSR